jgi:two-component system LytT family response regulator
MAEPPIRVILVDDEAPARARLRQLLKSEPDFEIVAECANGRTALERINEDRPDLVFLDIQMPGMTGLEICRALPSDKLPCIVFVTAYDRFALQAFAIHAIDYLLKPFDRERFQDALRHARDRVRGGRGDLSAATRLAAVLEELRAGARKGLDRLAFRVDGRVIFIRTADIDWIEADGNYVMLHMGTRQQQLRETLQGLEAQLPVEQFLRVSRSALVNLDRVKELQPLFYGDYVVVMENGARVNMSRSYRDRVDKILHHRP